MEAEAFANHQLTEACIVVIDEATAGLALAKRAITAYLESNGESCIWPTCRSACRLFAAVCASSSRSVLPS